MTCPQCKAEGNTENGLFYCPTCGLHSTLINLKYYEPTKEEKPGNGLDRNV